MTKWLNPQPSVLTPNSLIIFIISSLAPLKGNKRKNISITQHVCWSTPRAQFSTKQSFIPPPKHEKFLHFHPFLLCRLTKKQYLCVLFRDKFWHKRYENHKPQSKKTKQEYARPQAYDKPSRGEAVRKPIRIVNSLFG